MNKKLSSFSIPLFLSILTILLTAYSSNPPEDYTGSPNSNGTCATCHGGGSFDGAINLTGLPSELQANSLHTITVTVSNPDGNANRAGFQFTILGDDNQSIGTLSNPSNGAAIQNVGNNNSFAEHRPAQSFNNDNQATWTFDYQAPASGTEQIKIYAAANIANGSGTSGDVVVTEQLTLDLLPAAPPLSAEINNTTNVTCNGGSNGTATVEVEGGIPPYTYTWSNNAGNTATVSNLLAGTYTVTVTDADMTTTTAQTTLTEAPPISINIQSKGDVDCNNNFGFIVVQASNGAGNYSYAWSNGNTGTSINQLAIGTYTVTVTDNNNCQNTSTIEIRDLRVFPVANAGEDAVITCASGPIRLDGTGSTASSNDNLTYSWEAESDGNIIADANTATPLVDAAGHYILTVTNNGNGCTDQDRVDVMGDLDLPTAIIATPDLLPCNGTITLDGSNSSGSNMISYQWSTSSGGNIIGNNDGATVVVDAAGTYTLTITNIDNGCSDQTEVSVQAADAPTAMATVNGVLTCTTTTLTLSGNGSTTGNNISYIWTTNNGNIVNGVNTLTPQINAAGIYMLRVTNTSTNCSSTASVTVTANATLPVTDAGMDAEIPCNNDRVQLDARASDQGNNFTYQWTASNGGNIIGGATGLRPTVNSAGTYTLTITNTASGCVNTDEVIVTNSPLPIVDAGIDSNVGCNAIQITLDGTGSQMGDNLLYTWTTMDGNIVSGESTLTPTIDAPGTYSLSIFNTQTGCAATDEVMINMATGFDLFLENSSDILCHGDATGVAAIGVTGGTAPFNYQWSNGITTANATQLMAGTYTVSVVDANQCTNTIDIMLSEPDTLIVEITSTDESEAGANDGRAQAIPTGGVSPYSFTWSNGATTAFIMNLEAGTYSVTVQDTNGCTSVISTTVNAAACDVSIINVQSTNVSCNGGNDGSASIIANNGVTPYTYIWSNGATTAAIDGLVAGTYGITVTDNAGCTATTSTTVTEPEELVLGLSTSNSPSCPEGEDGFAIANVSGGVSPYTFQWSEGSTISLQEDLAAGTYSVTVFDDNGCFDDLIVEVVDPEAMTANITSTNESQPGAADGTANIMVMGGNMPYTYLWSDGQTSSTASNLRRGVYNVTVTDSRGCTITVPITVDVNDAPDPLIVMFGDIFPVFCNGESNGYAEVVASAGTPPYTYIWSNGATDAENTNLSAGDYSVTISDSNNEMIVLMVTITEPTAVTGTVDITHESAPNANDGQATISPMGGTAPYRYDWPMGQNGPSVSGLSPDQYSVTIIDAMDCAGVVSFQINSAMCGEFTTNINTTNAACPGALTGSATIVAEGGVAPYSYSWSSGGTSATETGLGAGNYSVTVTDANGCPSTNSFSISDVDNTPPIVIVNDFISVQILSSGTAVITTDMIDNGSTDNCDIAGFSLSQTEIDCSAVGDTIAITLTVTDQSTNSNSAVTMVEVRDRNPPQITCPDNLMINSNCIAIVEYDLPVVIDNCDNYELTLVEGLGSGAAFPNGTTTETYQVTDAGEVTETCSFDVVVTGEPITLEVTVIEPTCAGFNDGRVEVEVNGGTAPFNFSIDAPSVNELSVGTYTISVTDDEGCSVEQVIEVGEPDPIEITVTDTFDSTEGAANGGANITIMGGSGMLTFEWINENDEVISMEQNPNNLPKGTYIVRVMDETGCFVASDPIIIDDIVTNIETPAIVENIELYPNPTTGKFLLDLSLSNSEFVQITLYNFTGKHLATLPVQTLRQHQFQLDLSPYTNGIYWVRVQIGTEWVMRRIVKQ